MACFIAPVAEAIVVTAIKRSCKKNEEVCASTNGHSEPMEKTAKITLTQKLSWLTNMLWGGSFLLAIEHIWHGEIVPFAPFLTALNNPADIGPMLMEIATVGVAMSVVVTAAWAVLVLAVHFMEKSAMALSGGKRMGA